jgi:tetratricopeptide (TPR) repeat protein
VDCLSDERTLALVCGELGGGELAEADRHLDRCADCRDLIAELALAAGGGALPRGAAIDRYVILEVIGRGAMGVVYSAFDPELDRRVALKLVDGDLSGEARAMAQLQHPNVIAVYDARTEGDAAFIAMELVDGRTLREWLADEEPRWPRIREVFAAAGRGLEAAHRAEIVHRDFKPDNVMIGDGGEVRVGDFGLATSGGGEGAAGTPAYMAPEQLGGAPADARTDQFSFCASLYEALAGRRPFDGDDRDAEPESIGGVPGWLDRAVRRGLHRDPDRRWPSMASLLEAIDHRPRRAPLYAGAVLVVAGIVAVLAFAGRDRPAASPPCQGAAGEVAAVWSGDRSKALAAALGGGGSGYEPGSRAALLSALDQWRDRWVDARESVCRATRVDGTQSERLLDARMHCLDRGLRRAAALIDRVEAAGRAALPRIPAIIARLPVPEDCRSRALTLSEPPTPEQARRLVDLEPRLDAIGAAIAVGDHAGAERLAVALVAEASSLGYDPFVAEALLARSRARRGLDRLADAAADAAAAVIAAQRSGADAIAVAAWIARASIAAQRGDLDGAAEHRDLAAAAVERIGRPRDLAAEVAELSGLVHYNRGELADARAAFERALELFGDGVEVAGVLTGLGNVDRAAGELESALARHTRAGEIDRARFGDRHPAVARSLHNQAGALRLLGRAGEALERYRASLAIKIAALGAAHSEVALTRNSIALIHIERGELDRAVAELEAALAIYEERGSPERAVVLRNLGLVAERRGDRGAARERFAAALEAGGLDSGELRADLARVSRPPEPAPPQKPEPEPEPEPERPPATYMPGQAWD